MKKQITQRFAHGATILYYYTLHYLDQKIASITIRPNGFSRSTYTHSVGIDNTNYEKSVEFPGL